MVNGVQCLRRLNESPQAIVSIKKHLFIIILLIIFSVAHL